jgi:very-short-patch-repair endonuclease
MWWRVGAIAEGQHGVVSREQLRDAGLAEAGIAHAIATGRLYRVSRSAFAVGHRRIGRHGRLMAATLACGTGSVVSHGTAASLLGLWEWVPDRIDVISPVETGRKIEGICRRFVPPPSPTEVLLHEGVPTTSPSRTIVDVAGIAREAILSRTIEQAAVLRMLDVPEIDSLLAGPRRRGSPRLRTVLDDWRRYSPGIHLRSRMEAKLLPLLNRGRLPIPECNQKLRLEGETFEIDFLWRQQRVAVETDGGKFHDNPTAGSRDSHRNRVMARAGYSIPRLGWEDLRDRPEATMAEIARLLTTSPSAVP